MDSQSLSAIKATIGVTTIAVKATVSGVTTVSVAKTVSGSVAVVGIGGPLLLLLSLLFGRGSGKDWESISAIKATIGVATIAVEATVSGVTSVSVAKTVSGSVAVVGIS